MDGRVESRTRVLMERVESDVVLICDGYNREARSTCCARRERGMFFVRDTTLHVVLSQTRKNLCAGVRRLRATMYAVQNYACDRVWCSHFCSACPSTLWNRPSAGASFLDAKLPLVSSPQIWERTDCAHEVHTFKKTPRDGILISRIFDVVPRALEEFDGVIP